MNAERLLQHFDRIAEAPDAVPRLRQFVLELAVRGKLVSQDSTEEPATELLKHIQAEKERRVKQGKMKKQEPLSPVHPDEVWFQVPVTWQWVRLGAITHVVMGQSPPGETYNTIGEGIPLINGPVEFTEGPFGKTVLNQYTTAPTNLCEEGDLLLCVRGSTTGRTNIAAFRACIGRGVAAIQSLFDDSYVRLFVWRLRESIIAMGRGIAFPSVSRKQIEELAIPLPPLAEQHRIIAKVDELMAHCDQLEAARMEREQNRDRLVAASLHRLSQPTGAAEADASEAFRDHARFVFNHLPRLTTRPEHIRHYQGIACRLSPDEKIAYGRCLCRATRM
jgi:type I restriction enzyme, S subunit